MAALAVVAVVHHRHLLLALARTLAQRKTETKELGPRFLYIEVSDDLMCGILL